MSPDLAAPYVQRGAPPARASRSEQFKYTNGGNRGANKWYDTTVTIQYGCDAIVLTAMIQLL